MMVHTSDADEFDQRLETTQRKPETTTNPQQIRRGIRRLTSSFRRPPPPRDTQSQLQGRDSRSWWVGTRHLLNPSRRRERRRRPGEVENLSSPRTSRVPAIAQLQSNERSRVETETNRYRSKTPSWSRWAKVRRPQDEWSWGGVAIRRQKRGRERSWRRNEEIVSVDPRGNL